MKQNIYGSYFVHSFIRPNMLYNLNPTWAHALINAEQNQWVLLGTIAYIYLHYITERELRRNTSRFETLTEKKKKTFLVTRIYLRQIS
jgi:hypothetical protein